MAMSSEASTRRQLLIGGALAAGGYSLGPVMAAVLPANDGISRTAASIHQEPVFTASPGRVFEALIDPIQFDRVIQLSGVMKGAESRVATSICAIEGSAFALFGGYVTGRQVHLRAGELIVQAWRAGSWGPGLYSIARFQLVAQGKGSKIIFDHGGFPDAEAEHLAAGWLANYWKPLEIFLSQ
jgi:activator of HSP90 ATPase